MEDSKGEETSPVIPAMLFGKFISPICVLVVWQATWTIANFLDSISLHRVGGVLKIIGAYHLIDHCALREFLLTCQSPVMTNTSSLFCQLSYIVKLVMLFSFFFPPDLVCLWWHNSMEALQNFHTIGSQTSTILTTAWLPFPCWKRKGLNPSALNWGSSLLHCRNLHF